MSDVATFPRCPDCKGPMASIPEDRPIHFGDDTHYSAPCRVYHCVQRECRTLIHDADLKEWEHAIARQIATQAKMSLEHARLTSHRFLAVIFLSMLEGQKQ